MAKKICSCLIVGTWLVLGLAVNVQAIDVGVAWVGKSGMAKRVTGGLEQGFRDSGQNINLEFQKELASLDKLDQVVDRYEKEKQGLVILRSNGAKWLGQNAPAIPTFIGACNHPVQLGAVKNMKAPEGNITGVTYFLPVDTQFETFQAIMPDIQSVLLLVEKGHPSSAIDMEGTRQVCQDLGIAYNSRKVSSKQEAIAAVQDYAGQVSLAIIGNQAVVIDNAKAIVKAAGSLPVVSYSSKPVKDGALGGFVADDAKLGRMLAESVVDVLVNGKAIKDVPIKVDPKPKFYVNATTAERLGVDVPYDILQFATVIE